MNTNVKNLIDEFWLDSRKAGHRLTAQHIQQHIRMKTNTDGTRVFKSDEYPTLNQIRYRMRKVSQKYGITPQQELIDELTEINVE